MAYGYENKRKTNKTSLLHSRNYSADSRLSLDEAPQESKIAPIDESVRIHPKRTNNLEELSEELDRRTRETQQLQKEVEHATQLTMERMGRTLGASPLQTYPLSESLFKENLPTMVSVVRDPVSQPVQDIPKALLGRYPTQVSMLQKQLSETHRLHEQQKLLLRETIVRLQAQLHEVQVEKDTLVEWSATESRRQAEARDRLVRKQEELERVLQEVGAALSARAERSNGLACASLVLDDLGRLSLGIAVDVALREAEADNARLQARLQCLGEQLQAVTSDSQEQAELLVKEQMGRKQAEAQVSVYQAQVTDLEASLAELRSQLLEATQAYQDQKEQLQLQVSEAQAQVEGAQRDREQSIQQAREHESHLCQLKAELGRVREELEQQQESNRQLCERDTAHGSALEVLRQELNQRCAEVRQLEEEAASLKQERWDGEELRAEGAALQLELEDRDAAVERLRLQLGGLVRLSAQQSHSLDTAQTDRSRLSSQLEQHRLEVQQLKCEQAQLGQQQARAGALERELSRAHAALAKKAVDLRELGLERQHLAAEVHAQSVQLDALAEEQVNLKETHGVQRAELEGANARLRCQLQAVRGDLDQAKSTLRALQDADGQGLKAAASMQKQITSKRQQVDALQGRIQLLEETVDRLSQEKHTSCAEEHRRKQHLAKVRAERRRLESEVEALHSLEMQLRGRVRGLEAALDKVSKRFMECQEHVQQQEQELGRLRLQQALDARELQGLTVRSAGRLHHAELATCQNDCAPPEPKPCVLQESPALELRFLVQELRSLVEDENRTHPHRQSAPERLRPSGLETGTLCSSASDGPNLHCSSRKGDGLPDVQHRCGSLLRQTELELGRKSPVYSLLTSDPQKTPPTAISSTVHDQDKRKRRRVKDRNKL